LCLLCLLCLLCSSPEYKWLEKACTVTKPAGSPDRWLVTLTEVEELKCIVRLLPVMLTLIVYNSVYAQMTTLFILQGEGMDTQLGSLNVAPATVSVLDSISVIIWVVLCECCPCLVSIGSSHKLCLTACCHQLSHSV
jgi:peptide/histidine transporter 3/4